MKKIYKLISNIFYYLGSYSLSMEFLMLSIDDKIRTNVSAMKKQTKINYQQDVFEDNELLKTLQRQQKTYATHKHKNELIN